MRDFYFYLLQSVKNKEKPFKMCMCTYTLIVHPLIIFWSIMAGVYSVKGFKEKMQSSLFQDFGYLVSTKFKDDPFLSVKISFILQGQF